MGMIEPDPEFVGVSVGYGSSIGLPCGYPTDFFNPNFGASAFSFTARETYVQNRWLENPEVSGLMITMEGSR